MFSRKIFLWVQKFLRLIFVLASDVLTYYFAMFVSLFLRQLFLPKIVPGIEEVYFLQTLQSYIFSQTYVILLIIVVVFFATGLYTKRNTFSEEILLLWKMLIISSLICYLFLFNFKEVLPVISRFVIVTLFIQMVFLLPLFRFATRSFLFLFPFFRIPLLIVSSKEDKDRLIQIVQIFAQDVYLGFKPEKFFIPDDEEEFCTIGKQRFEVIKDFDLCPKDSVVFVIAQGFTENTMLSKLYSRYKEIYLMPNENVLGLINSGMQYLFSERLLMIRIQNKLNSLYAHFIKYLMDKVLGLIIVLILSPLLILLALLIKIFSPGPIFYKQERIGKGGKSFWIWKFRTMYVDAEDRLKLLLEKDPELAEEWKKYFKLKQDPRITKIGKFLRKYSLDEFPQLFNVLQGDMSLVGPRPFVDGEIEEDETGVLSLYHQVKPGLTGLWQVSGRNNNNRIKRVGIDIWYIQNWNVSLDILILLNTPKAVFSGRGAS